jgi:ElaB/YqjD/DUF883 family membrane-anchored ribosome-binding protein
MPETMHTLDDRGPNVVDRAAQRADRALDATRRAAVSAVDAMSDKVHGVRDTMSPRLDAMSAPLDRVTGYTRDAPVRSLLAAAAVGAILMALVSLVQRRRA